MRILLAAAMSLHGAIHLVGFARAFGLAEIPHIESPITPRTGLLWLAAAVLFWMSAALLLVASRYWWVPAAAGVVLSQALIVGAWSDARFGTVVNLVVLVPVALAAADHRGSSLRSTYEAEAERHRAAVPHVPPTVVTEADLDGLPGPVGRWLRRAGVVGEPRVRSIRVRFRGRIRSAPDAGWMSGAVEQHGFFHPVVRLFFMKASRWGVPVDVFHRYVGTEATMEARLVGLLPVVDAGGSELTRSETVTVLNDMVLLAPGALLDAPVTWEAMEGGRAGVTYRNAGHRVAAVLHFDSAGDLADFHSDDRYQWDGEGYRSLRWSTPVREYGTFAGLRLPKVAEARWSPIPEGTSEVRPDRREEGWTYARFVVQEVEYDVGLGGR